MKRKASIATHFEAERIRASLLRDITSNRVAMGVHADRSLAVARAEIRTNSGDGVPKTVAHHVARKPAVLPRIYTGRAAVRNPAAIS